MAALDVIRAVTVSFSCSEFSALQHCTQCGRHGWCRGDETDELICRQCFGVNSNSFRPPWKPTGGMAA